MSLATAASLCYVLAAVPAALAQQTVPPGGSCACWAVHAVQANVPARPLSRQTPFSAGGMPAKCLHCLSRLVDLTPSQLPPYVGTKSQDFFNSFPPSPASLPLLHLQHLVFCSLPVCLPVCLLSCPILCLHLPCLSPSASTIRPVLSPCVPPRMRPAPASGRLPAPPPWSPSP